MRDLTVDEIARLGALPAEADEPFHMTEEAFRMLYERTARSLWAYLTRMTGDARLADDLLQETYYRFLKSSATLESDDHRKNYLFRIATNVAHDARRRSRVDGSDNSGVRAPGDVAELAARRVDVGRALARMKPRDRALVWLAYVNGSSHKEIADALGLKPSSIKLMLYRARRRLAALLRGGSR